MFRRPPGAPPPAERGQSIVEFTLLFPMLVFLLLFIIEISVALYTTITVTGAAREAARFAAVANLIGDEQCVDDLDGTVRGRAVSTGSDIVLCDEVAIWFVDVDADAEALRGDAVVVKITHEYTLFTPIGALASALTGGAIPASFTIGACADARLEAPYDPPAPDVFPGWEQEGSGDCES